MLRPIQLNLSQSDMDIRIGNKLFVITLLIFLLGSSCTNSSISEMEELVGIPMKRELTLSTEYSQWNDFLCIGNLETGKDYGKVIKGGTEAL